MARSGHVPLRMCVVCRAMRPREELFRMVRSKAEGTLRLDLERRRTGKGVYLCRSEECLTRLRKERRLRKLFLEKMEAGACEVLVELLGSASPSPAARSASRGERLE